MEEKGTSMKQISPKPLYSLVMATFSGNKAAPPWPSARMGKHIPGYFNVLSALVTSDPRRKSKILDCILKQL